MRVILQVIATVLLCIMVVVLAYDSFFLRSIGDHPFECHLTDPIVSDTGSRSIVHCEDYSQRLSEDEVANLGTLSPQERRQQVYVCVLPLYESPLTKHVSKGRGVCTNTRGRK